METVIHIPYFAEQDDDGVWCAHVYLRRGVGAHGEGATRDEAIVDLEDALRGLLLELGPPDVLTIRIP
ncbi:hypothetical protein GBF35_05175 [Nonomuraea phyllanthi]|uniref:hypothetical protein n=1 Tax=Nonomuraea phyllanthi TaxID=2219224 RepID=UPI0012937EB5|nr:hypothetical protein [Nonomuraea phyllanthi]QFY06147.1 hypothetical protein GBF35_05175 [Nonomuraea phyllanthi]